MSNFSPLLNALNKSIRLSGKKIIRDFGEIEKLQSSVRQTEKFAQLAKSKLEKDLHQILKKIKPDFKIITFDDQRDQDCWIIDLIDGSRNFARGIDNFSINISLQENKKIKTNIFYNPIKDETFFFQAGIGGYKNDSRVRVSEKKLFKESIFSFFSKIHQSRENEILCNIKKVVKKEKIATRESGSICSDIGFLASGKIECLIFITSNINLKNQISLVLSETGGVLNTLDLFSEKIYIASNNYIGKITKEMIENNYESK